MDSKFSDKRTEKQVVADQEFVDRSSYRRAGLGDLTEVDADTRKHIEQLVKDDQEGEAERVLDEYMLKTRTGAKPNRAWANEAKHRRTNSSWEKRVWWLFGIGAILIVGFITLWIAQGGPRYDKPKADWVKDQPISSLRR